MKSSRVSFYAVAVLGMIAQACADPIDTGDDIGLHVTQVQAPASIQASGPITVTLTVAVSGCQQFDHIAASKTPGTLTLAARGTKASGTCDANIIHETHSHTEQGPFTNPLTITVYRPTADPLIATVQVE